jgi:hypothetical protein
MRYLWLVFLVLLLGCVPEAEQPLQVSEIEFYDGEHNYRFSYYYGRPGEISGGTRTMMLSSGQIEHDMAVPGALLVDGRPMRVQELEALTPRPFEVQRAAMSTDMIARTTAPVANVVYFDGRMWFDLLTAAEAGLDARVTPRQRLDGLRGLGQLSPAEADMLQELLEARGPVALGFLPEPLSPPQEVVGAEVDEYRRTALVIQTGVPTALAAAPADVPEVAWEELASGAQATDGPQLSYHIATSREAFLTLWNQAYGARLTPPELPEVDFRQESVIAVFAGQKPTGGYGVMVREIRQEGGDLIVLVEETQPGPGDIVTQALTHPWAMVTVARPELAVAWVRDARTDELIGVARPLDK